MNLWRIVDEATLPANALQPVFDPTIGTLSLILAMLGAYALFPAVERMRNARSAGSRWQWLTYGAVAMGFGFWSMNWMAMTGFGLPVPMHYSPVWVLLSLVPATGAGAAAIAVLAVRSQSSVRIAVGSGLLGFGLCAMQLLTLESLVAPVTLHYRGDVLLRALVVGVGSAFIAMYVNRLATRNVRGTLAGHLSGSLFLGTAAVGTHFAVMGAAVFGAVSGAAAAPVEAWHPILIPAIAVGTLIVVGSMWAGSRVDRRLAETAALSRDAQGTFSAVIQALPDAVIIFEPDGRLITINPAAAKMFGYTPDEMHEISVSQLMPPAARERFKAELTGDAGTLMSRFAGTRHVFAEGGCRKDGTCFPVEITLQGLPGQGAQMKMACIVRDLTTSWGNNARTRRLAAAVAGAEEAIALMDGDGIIEYVNASYERMSGFALADVRGQPPRRALSDPKTHDLMWRAVRGPSGAWRGRVNSIKNDGTPFIEDMTLTRVAGQFGEEPTYVKISRDVTEDDQRERDRSRIMTAVENCADGIEITDVYGFLVYANPVRQKILGKSLAELQGKRLEDLLDLSVEPAANETIMQQLQKGQPWQGLYSYRIPENGVRVEHLSITPIFDSAGSAHSYVLIRRDVSEQRRLEEDLARARKLESVGQLAAGIAHEINTPIQYVSDNVRFVAESFGGIGDLLTGLQKFVADDPGAVATELSSLITAADVDFCLEEIPKALAQSADGCNRVAAIVRAMKEFCHPGSDKVAVDLNKAISSTITVASNEWKYVADIKTEFDPALPMVSCIVSEVNQVVLNLLVNAAHAIAEVVGDGANGKGTIALSTRCDGDCVEIRVRDTGGGIKPEIRERIFDPFFTTKAIGKGTGQGLAIAHDVIVNKHGGQILLESEVGKGSTFVLRLPLAPPAPASAKAA